MKTFIGNYDLLNVQTDEFEEAFLYEGIDEKNLSDFGAMWLPEFKSNKPDEISQESIMDANMEDGIWDWKKLESEVQKNRLRYEIYAIECNGCTQGLMLVDKVCCGKHPEQVGKPIIYVTLLATAPWNRPRLSDNPLYRGVGRTLISCAISLSLEEEFEGRIGLHSLLGAEVFYRTKIGMTDLDIGSGNSDLRYFEMTMDQAKAFISE